MIKRITALGIVALASTASAWAAPTAQPPPLSLFTSDMSGSDLEFLNTAAEEGLRQAALGDLASKRAEAGPIKTFGEALSKDHAAEGADLKRLAAEKQVSLPATVSPRQKQIDRKLAMLTGEKFNKACMDQVIEVQQRQIDAYEEGARSEDADIRTFAEKSLPPLKEHLLLAKKIAGIASAGKLFKTAVPVPGAQPTQPLAAVAEGDSASSPAAALPPEGSLEMADANLIAGWAYDPNHPNEPLSVEIYDGTTVLATVVAKEFRGDLKSGGKGDGKHFFMLPTPASFKDGKAHWIRAAVVTTHFELPGSPRSVVFPGATP